MVLKNFRIIDESADMVGAVLIEKGLIREIIPGEDSGTLERLSGDHVIDGRLLVPQGNTSTDLPVLLPALVDLHTHFRDPGFPAKETLESASLAAVAGGVGTVVCMANTMPVTDSVEKALDIRCRSRTLGLIDLFPALSLTQGMEGKELSEIRELSPPAQADRISIADRGFPLLLSEDGKDVADESLFLAALGEARRLEIPVSCHCDFGGEEVEAARREGKPRSVWSRIEENNATRRAIELGKKALCHIHIAHVSTKEAAELVRQAKKTGMKISAEASPHHILLTEDDARVLGDESWGRVNPSLRSEADRRALIAAVLDGTIDAIATDHAPHSGPDKAAGAPGFTGFETSFSACFTELVKPGRLDLKRLSFLMSANPARILGLGDRGRIAPGLRADLFAVDINHSWKVDVETFKSRGHNSPFQGRELSARILFTLFKGRMVFAQG